MEDYGKNRKLYILLHSYIYYMTYKDTVEGSNSEIELCFSKACDIVNRYKYENFDHMRRAISELTIGLYVDIKDLKSKLIGHNGKIPVPLPKESCINEIKKYNQERLI